MVSIFMKINAIIAHKFKYVSDIGGFLFILAAMHQYPALSHSSPNVHSALQFVVQPLLCTIFLALP